MNKLILIIFLFFSFAFNYLDLISQSNLNVTILNNPSPGYYFIQRNEQTNLHLFDNYGENVFEKESIAKKRKKLLENGLIAEFAFNKYYLYNQDFNLIDSIINPTNYLIDMHDIVALKNGHYLMLMNNNVTMDLSNIVEGGKESATIMDNILIETDGKGNIFWTWSGLDYLKLTDVTSAVDLTMNVIDPFHINSIFEDTNGNILISIRHFDEIALINKQTKQFIWRFGGQNSKNNEYTILNDEIDGFKGFSHQHTASILSNGNILMFDNGNLKPNQYSRAVEYSINHQNKTATKVWEFRNTPDVYTFVMGSAYRLENGNTLICWGWANNGFTEVRPDKTIVFETISDNITAIYRVQKTNLNQQYASVQVNSAGTYLYNSSNNITGVTVKVNTIEGSGGNTHIQKHYYPPHSASFSDNKFYAILPYRWVYSHDGGFSSISGELQVDVSTIKEVNFPQGIAIYKRNGENNGDFNKLETTFDASNNKINAKFYNFGEFVLTKTKISGPELLIPRNNAISVPVYGELNWKKVPYAMKYKIQISSSINFEEKKIDTIIANASVYNYKGLNHKQQYFWRVCAISGTDTTDWSEIFTFRTNIDYPTIINPKYNSFGFKNKDSFIWDNITGAKSYHFQLSDNQSFKNLILDSLNFASTTIKANGLNYNTKYYCRVRGIDSQDTSDWSNVVVFTTALQSPKLLYPADISVDINVPVQLQWEKVTGAEEYLVEISGNTEFTSETTQQIFVTDTTLIINKLEESKGYFWRVKALRLTDTSDWSDVFNFVTKSSDTSTIKLLPPSITYPNKNEFAVPVDCLLRWSKVENAQGYVIKLTNLDKNEFEEYSIANNSTTLISFCNDQLEYNTKYKIEAKAISDSAESSWSSPIIFTTELKTPKIISPINLSTEVPPQGLFDFQTDSNFDLHLQVSRDVEFLNIVLDKIGLKDNIIEYSLDGETTYFARLMQLNDSNRSRWSDTISFTTRKITSVINYNQQKVYINYNNIKKQIIIVFNEINVLDQTYKVAIYNILGNIIFEQNITSNLTEINTEFLSKGIYFITLKSQKNQAIKKQLLYLY